MSEARSDKKSRTIQTTYFGNRNVVLKVNKASYANSAVLRAVDHMQMNDYGARVAEVFDDETSELHAVITNNVKGEIRIIYKRDVTEEK